MTIDFGRLKQERTDDFFGFAPIDVEQSVGLTAEVMRDNCWKNPEIRAAVGNGVSRVKVTSPSPRLRQRLAILGWMPLDPANDEHWYIDEPIELQPDANHLIARFVAQYYAEGMNLLFAPDDGMFEGAAHVISPAADATSAALRAHVKTLAEQAYVMAEVRIPRVPVTNLQHSIARALNRANAARARSALPALVAPALSTVSRWKQEFEARHLGRPGLGATWRSYERRSFQAGSIDAERVEAR